MKSETLFSLFANLQRLDRTIAETAHADTLSDLEAAQAAHLIAKATDFLAQRLPTGGTQQ